MSADCLFCTIIEERSYDYLAEDELTVSFFPKEPAMLGHSLVLPRAHVPDFLAAPSDVTVAVSLAVQRLGLAIRSALQPSGLNVISSAGRAASQTIFHWHVHVLPRMPHDRIGDIWPEPTSWAVNDLETAADQVREALHNPT